MRLAKRCWLGWFVLLALIVMWLGARKLAADGLWFDEWWSLYVSGADVFHVSRSVGDILARVADQDIRQGLLYPLALAGWGSAVGWSLFATRALSLFAGLISLAGVYRLGASLGKHPLVGLSAAALLGTSLWFIYYLHEMRVYLLLVMLTTLLLLIYMRIMTRRTAPRWSHYAALALITGLLLNTHYFAFLVVGVIGLAHVARLIGQRPDRRWWSVIGAWLIAGVMLIPLALNLPRAAETALNEPRVQPDLALLATMARDTFTAFSNTNVGLLALLLAFALLARRARPLWLIALVLLPLNLAAYYVFSLNELRYNMAILPLLALIAGFGVYELARRRVPPILIVGIWALSIVPLDGNFQLERMIQHWPNQPIEQMAAVLAPRVQTDDVIVNLLGDENRPTLVLTPLMYYMGDFGARIEIVENSTIPGTQRFVDRVRQALGEADRLWLLYDPRWESQEWTLFEYLLNQQQVYHCGTIADAQDMRIWTFGRVNDSAEAIPFGDGVRIEPIGAPRISDGLLQVWLSFTVSSDVPPQTYSLALHLLDGAGQVRAQVDQGLPEVGQSCRYFEIPVADLPDGAYALHAAVYNWQTGERLASIGADGAPSDYPLLSTVTH